MRGCAPSFFDYQVLTVPSIYDYHNSEPKARLAALKLREGGFGRPLFFVFCHMQTQVCL